MHALIAFLNLPYVTYAYGDVTYVYTYWVDLAETGDIVGITGPWVYPLLAWLPILASSVFGTEALPVMWGLLVTVLNAVGFAMLLRIPRGAILAWTWLAMMLAMGPIAMGRIDAIAAAVALIGFVVLRRNPESDRSTLLAAALFTVGAWIKVWTGVLWLTMLVTQPRRLTTLAGGAFVTGGVLAVGGMLGSEWLFSFATEQGSRGLQIEAVVATPYMWSSALGGGASVEYDNTLLTNQIVSESAASVGDLMTPLLVVAAGLIAALGVIAVRRGEARETAVWLALALVSALIVFNKVGSPQFIVWLVIPLLLLAELGGRRQWWFVGAILLAASLTQLIFPWTFYAVVNSEVSGVLLLTVRNALYVAIFIAALWLLAKLAFGPRTSEPASAESVAEDGSDPVLLDKEGVVSERALKHEGGGA